MPVVRAGEVELDYERSGSGPPLLLIMGMSGTALHWGEPFLCALREDFELIAYDHRGVGNSTALDGPVTILQMAQDAVALLDALELDSAHVLGISMGGMVAQELAITSPERVAGLVLACTTPGWPAGYPMPAASIRLIAATHGMPAEGRCAPTRRTPCHCAPSGSARNSSTAWWNSSACGYRMPEPCRPRRPREPATQATAGRRASGPAP